MGHIFVCFIQHAAQIKLPCRFLCLFQMGKLSFFFFSSNFADLSSSSCDFDQATVLFVVVISALFIAEVIASFFVFVLQDWNGLT